ncbi:MAG: YcgJ family protein [Cyanobacteriota bacterium]|nr:YcgJ family protein [Cyanobacteriota bacterium]
MVAPSAPHRCRVASVATSPSALLALSLATALFSPLAVRAQTVQTPMPGVICDAAGPRGSGVCYDRNGVSPLLTGRFLGRQAEAQLNSYLATNPAPKDFRLSNGTVCSVPERTCWQDGWTKGNIAHRLTFHLFGTAVSGTVPPAPVRDTGLCSLTRAGRPVFEGSCDLRQATRTDGLRVYRVRLANGTTYTFSNRGGTVTIADPFGATWPVTYVNHGVTGIFRWSEMGLVATQTASGLPATTPPGTTPPATTTPGTTSTDELGRALGSLLNTLFR